MRGSTRVRLGVGVVSVGLLGSGCVSDDLLDLDPSDEAEAGRAGSGSEQAGSTGSTSPEPAAGQSSVSLDQWAFTVRWEGVVPHLYLDTVGIPTCGVGFSVPTEAELVKLPWTPSVQTAVEDYNRVRKQPKGQAASAYEPFCNARLSTEAMHRVFDEKIEAIERQLQDDWQLAMQPAAVQIALVDMAYNLGVAGLGKFVKLKAAVARRDWVTAAAESSRRGVQQPRNDATRELFLAAASDEGVDTMAAAAAMAEAAAAADP